MTDETTQSTACPVGGCTEIRQINRRLDDGATRMGSIEAALDGMGTKLDNHIETSTDTNATVTEVLEILHAGRGFFKILGYIATAIKWTAGLAAPVIGLWYVLKDHAK